MSRYLPLLVSILLALGAGLIGSAFTFAEIPTWYASLVMPAIAPPNWVFGPVWTTLYILMGIAAWMVWKAVVHTEGGRRAKRVALGVYVFQLALNTLWSLIFFGLHALGLALVELVVLWAAILATMVAFFPISRTAAWLLVPYLVWVSFAGYLNYSFWLLN